MNNAIYNLLVIIACFIMFDSVEQKILAIEPYRD